MDHWTQSVLIIEQYTTGCIRGGGGGGGGVVSLTPARSHNLTESILIKYW